TTLFDMKRSKELLLRWCDFSAFTPMMRTHEGNRPGDNWQFDGDADTIAHFARMTTVFTTLKPYLKQAVAQNARTGLPVMRPLFFDYHEDEEAWKHGDAYLFGPDILVSPVTEAGCTSKAVYLPKGADWREVETGKVYAGGQTVNCETPLCVMPVFVREGAELDWTLLKRR
ncbi:TIM-barrel domain-containing protein, partial [Hominenteromicrobium sp.]|uniref:TIM-barrel domain-containing protein n=1 Tax=Hominenteromicrobium sp. TaxID=3073581 RepID=UPI003A8DB490